MEHLVRNLPRVILTQDTLPAARTPLPSSVQQRPELRRLLMLRMRHHRRQLLRLANPRALSFQGLMLRMRHQRRLLLRLATLRALSVQMQLTSVP